jgi:MFS family permease
MWKNKNVWIILSGEFIAGLGLWFGIIGNLEFMQHHIPSDFMKSLVMFMGLLAGVIVGPTAGKMIDQYSKKKILLYSGFGRLFSVSFMFLAIYFENIWYMVLFMVTIQISAAFYFPALQSVIPLIVKEKDLLQLNGVHMNIATIGRIVGTSLGGALLVVMSLEYMYVISMLAYALLLVSTYFLQFEEVKPLVKEEKNKKSAGFTEVFHILKQIPIAYKALILSIIPLLFIGGFNLMVIDLSEMHDDSTLKGYIYAVEGIAFMLGAFIIKKLTTYASPFKLLYIFSIITAIAHLSLFFSDVKWMALASFGLFGFAVGCFFPLMSTIFQTKIPKEYHGRLFSFRSMFDRVMFQIVLLGTGLSLDTLGLQLMVLIFGVISLLIIFVSSLKQKKVETSTIKPTASGS